MQAGDQVCQRNPGTLAAPWTPAPAQSTPPKIKGPRTINLALDRFVAYVSAICSSRNKLPFMILSPLEVNCRKIGFPAEKCIFPQKNAVSYRKMRFPAEKCIFLLKNAFSCRKMRFSGGHMAGNRRKLQKGFRAQESRTLANFHKICVTFLKRPRKTHPKTCNQKTHFSSPQIFFVSLKIVKGVAFLLSESQEGM